MPILIKIPEGQVFGKCHYCDSSPPRKNKYEIPSTVKKLSAEAVSRATVYANGIDRYDNSGHYTLDNSVPCCTKCNFLKHDMHGDDFIALCLKVSANMQKKEPDGKASNNQDSGGASTA